MRGRKKEKDTIKKTKIFGLRLTEEEHNVLTKNKSIRDELVQDFREHLKIYLFK